MFFHPLGQSFKEFQPNFAAFHLYFAVKFDRKTNVRMTILNKMSFPVIGLPDSEEAQSLAPPWIMCFNRNVPYFMYFRVKAIISTFNALTCMV